MWKNKKKIEIMKKNKFLKKKKFCVCGLTDYCETHKRNKIKLNFKNKKTLESREKQKK